MDTTKLGLECSEMMGELATSFPDDAEVGVVGLVVEITLEDDSTHLATFCSDTRRWVQIGLFQEASLVAGTVVANDGD